MRNRFHGVLALVTTILLAFGTVLGATTDDLKNALVDDPTTLASVTSLTVDAGVLSTAAQDVNPGFPSQITLLSRYLPSTGVVVPTRGGSFVALSSGDLFAPAEGGDVDYGTPGAADDTATITVTLSVPTGTEAIAFDFDFLSYEFPEYVGSAFNDFFSVSLTDAGGTRQLAFDAFGNPVTVNTVFFNPSLSLAGTGFELFNNEPSGPDAGRTGTLTTLAPITPGSTTLTLTFSTGDAGDGIYTSSAVVDNLRFTSKISADPITGETTFLPAGPVTNQTVFTDTEGNRVVLDAEVNTPGALTVFAQAATSVSPSRFPTGSGLSTGGGAGAVLYTVEALEGLTFKTTTQNGGTSDIFWSVDVPGAFDPTMGLCRAADENSLFADITSAPAECILADGSPCGGDIQIDSAGSLDDPTRIKGSTPTLSQYVPCHRDPVITLESGAGSLDLCHSGALDSVTLYVTGTFNPNPAALTVKYHWTLPTSAGPVSTTTDAPEVTFVPALGSASASVYATLLDSSLAVVGTSSTSILTLNKPTFIGFLDPIKNNGSSDLNGTQSIPVKFRVVCGGNFVGDLVARLQVEKNGVIGSGGFLSSGNSNPDDRFKYDPLNNLYRYTLQSKALSAGNYTLRVTFDGGVLPKKEVTLSVH